MNDDELIPLVPPDANDPRIQAAIAELRGLIAARYPDATFTVYHGEDPEGIYLNAVVDVEDLDAVTDTFIGRLVDLQVEGGLPVYVTLDWPIERVRAHLRRPAPPIEARLRFNTPRRADAAPQPRAIRQGHFRTWAGVVPSR